MDKYKHVEGQDMKTKKIVVQGNMEIYNGDKTGMKLSRSFVKLRPLTLLEWKLLNIDPVVKLTRIHPSNSEATFVLSTRTQRLLKTI